MDEDKVVTENQVEAPARPARPRSSVYPAPSRPTDPFVWLALPLVFALGLGSGWFLWGSSSARGGSQLELADQTTRHAVSVDDDPSIGPEDAAVTIVEFSDYQCPYCISWHNEVYNRLLTDYEGKIRFVYRDLPLSAIHPDAQAAAEAANCAGEQQAYWPYHDALFGSKYGLNAQAYTQYATELNLDVTAFNACVAERRYKDEVEADASFVRGLGFTSTPTFFINGLLVVGAQPYEVFQQIIDKELAGEIPK
jgi:protein-disulfide isomerase